MTFEPLMLVEEIEIIFETDCCPRCNARVTTSEDEDELTITCPGCHTTWGMSANFLPRRDPTRRRADPSGGGLSQYHLRDEK